jgi:hypothetical protein
MHVLVTDDATARAVLALREADLAPAASGAPAAGR